MNILVTGATGFIGSQIVTDLIAAGHKVTCCARDTKYAQNLFQDAKIISCNFTKDTNIETWEKRLKNIDAYINCVGILYHPNPKVVWQTHHDTPRTIFDACVKTGIKKIVQISALGVEKSDMPYAKSKLATDEYLKTLPIDSIIIRPSFVYGRGSYGGSSLFRGLAGLPLITPLPDGGKQTFQPIFLPDLSKAILNLLEKQIKGCTILSGVSAKRINLKNILGTLRSWLGFKPAKTINIPLWMIRLGALGGDLFPYSTLNSTAHKMLAQNNVTSLKETERFEEMIGFTPREFKTGVYNQPSTVQDRWHARLYNFKPVLRISIALLWIYTAICVLFFYPKSLSYHLLDHVGVTSPFWQMTLLYGSSFLNAVLGFAALVGYRLKQVYWLQILSVLAYTIVITWKIPALWLEPFAPIAKNIPILAGLFILLALKDNR